jgi:hypothetical protein
MKATRQNGLDGALLPIGQCGRCHRVLKNPTSIARGFGPVCWAKIQSGVRIIKPVQARCTICGRIIIIEAYDPTPLCSNCAKQLTQG